jgi:branched-chain amino acid transport system permease protein
VAVGYNVVFTASGTFNFAHAQLLMLGVFVSYWGLAVLKLPIAVVFLLAAAIVGVVAGVEERIAIRPVRGVEAQLVTTVGAATLIDGASQLIWGNSAQQVPFPGSTRVWIVLGGRVFPVELLLIAVAVVVVGALMWLSRRSMIGLALLAVAEDREAALLRGINVRAVGLGAFAFSGALAGLVAPIVGPKTFAVATLGTALALKAFVAVALGGFGSLPGGLVGGFAVGIAEQLTARYVGSVYVNLMVFAMLLLVLLLRPAGLFGTTGERVV